VTANGSDSARSSVGLASIVETVRRRWALALLPFLFVLAASVSLALFLPSLWTAKAVILVDRQQIPESFVKSTITSDVEARIMTLSQEIMSSAPLIKIIEAHQLYPDIRRKHSMEAAVDAMRRDIRIEFRTDERDRRSPRMIAFGVGYTTSDPQNAMRVANEVAGLYVDENVRYREKHSVSTSQFLGNQLSDVRARLQSQERRITDYKERHMGELPEQREANLRTLDRLQQQMQSAQETMRRANERRQLLTQALAEIDQTSGGNVGVGPNPTVAESTAARLSVLKQELAQMQTRYSDRYPDVISLKEQIQALEGRLAAEKQAAAPAPAAKTGAASKGKDLRPPPQNAYVQSLMQQLDQAAVDTRTTADEIKGLQSQIAVYQRRIENTPRSEQELALITRDYESTRELFRSLLGKQGEAEIAADLEQRQQGEHFRIIEPAGLPDRTAGPNRMRLLLIGLVLAVGAGGIAVVLAEHVDTSYRSVEDIRGHEPVPVLSTIPKIITERDRRRSLRLRRLQTAAVAAGLLAIIGTSFAFAHNNHAVVALLAADPASPRR
jgi:polysaccharide chain length determinant protein (PEP-CTERM system associated)